MFALLLLAGAVPDAPRPTAPAKASVRIERSIAARAADWDKKRPVQRREVRRTEPDGRTVLLRIVEHP